MKNPDTESCRVMVKGPRCQALVAWRSFVLDNPFHRTNFSWAFLQLTKYPTEVGTLNAVSLGLMFALLLAQISQRSPKPRDCAAETTSGPHAASAHSVQLSLGPESSSPEEQDHQ